MATDLADRMLPAFDTPTGLPASFVNLKKVGGGCWRRLRGGGLLLVRD
jgi:hypothetical protein